MSKDLSILLVGADLTSNGGIASVIKSYYSAYQKGCYDFRFLMLKTSHYKDSGRFSEMLILCKAIIQYTRYLCNKRLRLIHIHTSAHLSFYRKSIFVFLAKIFRKKVILHIHSSDFYSFFLSGSFYMLKLLSSCNCIVVLCTDWEKKLKKVYPEINIRKIENPFENRKSDHNNLNIAHRQINVLFMGFFIESKGIKDLLSLASIVLNKGINNICFQIAGKGDLENYILETVRKEKLQGIVNFKGWIEGKEKEKVFQQADIFILPSYKEGMPISILEAMSYGLPILSTNISGIPDLIEDGINGYLDKPGDVYTMFNHLKELVNDPEKRRNMGIKNIERAKLNSEEIIFEQITNLYYEVLK